MAIADFGGRPMISGAQMRAARALLGIDQKALAALAGVSVPTIQRMEASKGNVRGMIVSLTRIIEAFERAGIELIAEGATSASGGRGVRLTRTAAEHLTDISAGPSAGGSNGLD